MGAVSEGGDWRRDTLCGTCAVWMDDDSVAEDDICMSSIPSGDGLERW